MRFIAEVWERVRALGRGAHEDREMEEELRFHLDMEAQKHVKAGMSPNEARRHARLRFGGVERVKEEVREARGVRALEDLGKDLRYSVRGLAKSRGFTAVAVLSLALAIGVNTAVFSVVDAMLLRPFPYDDPDGLVKIDRIDLQDPDPGRDSIARVADYLVWKQRTDLFEEVAYQAPGVGEAIVASDGYQTERLWGATVSANLFSMLGAEPILGRGFLAEEGELGSDDVIIVSHSLWQRRFGAGATVIGETLWLDGTATTIVGVMASDFSVARFGSSPPSHFWVPARGTLTNDLGPVSVTARLRPSVSIEQARVAMDTLTAQRVAALPETIGGRAEFDRTEGWGVRLVSLHTYLTRDLSQTLFVLWGAAAFVLLIACGNVAGVLLARASSRRQEVATRLALGASRWRVVRLFLGEALLLGLAGGAVGSLLAYGGVRIIRVFNPDANPLVVSVFPRLDAASVDARVLGYTLLISLLTTLLFGLAPALRGSRLAPNESLKDAGRGATAGPGRLRVRSTLVVAQVALATVLLTGAGLMVTTMRNLAAVDLGFNADQVLTFRMSLSGDRYLHKAAPVGELQTEVSPRVDTFYARVLRRLQTLPGVESAAGIHVLPLSHVWVTRRITIQGRPAPPDAERPWHERTPYWAVMGDYFEVMGVSLLRGRTFTARDVAEAPWVVVINQAMADTYWPNEDPIGKQLTVVRGTIGQPTPGERVRTVVGVVANMRHWSVQEEPTPAMYVHHVQQPLVASGRGRRLMSYVVRTATEPMSLAPVVQRVVSQLDPDQPAGSVQPMEQLLAIWTDGPRFYTLLTAAFAAVALLLSLIGIYGVMAYTVTQRTHEIGIRMALGAGSARVVRTVAGRGLALGAGGVALGLLGSLWLTRLMQTLRVDFYDTRPVLYGVSARDPVTFAVIPLLLVGAVFLACYGPTRVATKVDPMAALRHE